MGQIGKFNAYGTQKAYVQENLQLLSYPTVLFFPKNSNQIIKYPSENRKVDALLGFVQALQ
jgi:adenylyl-sulfate reductase (glutathione)